MFIGDAGIGVIGVMFIGACEIEIGPEGVAAGWPTGKYEISGWETPCWPP